MYLFLGRQVLERFFNRIYYFFPCSCIYCYKVSYKGAFLLNNNMDINKLLSVLSKMDKAELEKNIYRAQQILNNSDIKKEFDKKD